MKVDDVPEEWLDALISQLPAKAAALIEEIDFRAALAAVALLIAEREREACAKLAEDYATERHGIIGPAHLSTAIRARKP